MKKIITLASAALLALTVAACSGSSSTDDSEETTPEVPEVTRVSELEARLQCENSVENQLKSPATADFSANRENTYTEIADDGLQVNGWVDSENAFGATVRSEWQCLVTPSGEDQFLVNVENIETR